MDVLNEKQINTILIKDYKNLFKRLKHNKVLVHGTNVFLVSAYPIWTKYYDEIKNKLMTGIETVDNDEELWTLNDGIQDLYSSFFK